MVLATHGIQGTAWCIHAFSEWTSQNWIELAPHSLPTISGCQLL